MEENNTECVGDWMKEKILGSGGFGMVILWRNKISKEAIALKQCRWGNHDVMTPKHRQRWVLEINIMKRLSHINVVTAVNVPPELDVQNGELPLLAMEYCSGSDLRRTLNKPENCCGIVETDVRVLIHDVSAAIQYLHGQRIAHRDLKPENIVLQDIDQKTRYKLIDLGYAKDLDEGSVCTSFVGTLQYLAPELFNNKKYTVTVDYWSLGLVIVECITGIRPFLHNLSPAKWIPYVKQKSPDDICAYVGDEGNVEFSREIFNHNQISRVFKVNIESWLKLLLEWDPVKRGRGNSDTLQVFIVLEALLKKKIIHVFCVHLGIILAYEITDDMTIGNIQNSVAIELNFKMEDQEVLTVRGIQISSDKLVIHFYTRPEDSFLYIYLKLCNDFKMPANASLPPRVEKIFADLSVKVKYDEQRKTWSLVVFYAKKECEIFSKLLQAHKILMTNLLSKNSSMNKSTNALMSAVNRLSAKHEFFISSLKQDVDHYENQAKKNGVCSKMMCDAWKSTMEHSLKIKYLTDEARKIELKTGKYNTRTVELQRSPYFKSRPPDNLDDVNQLILDLYDKLRKLPKEQRDKSRTNEDLVGVLYRFMKQRDKVKKEVYSHLMKLASCRKDISEIIDPIESCYRKIEEFGAELLEWQLQRQKDLWNLIKILVSKSHSVNGSSLSLDKSSLTTESPNLSGTLMKTSDYLLHPEQMDMEESQFSAMSVKDIMNHSSNESLRIMSDNRLLRHQIAGMEEALWQNHNEIISEKNSMDFSFLNDEFPK